MSNPTDTNQTSEDELGDELYDLAFLTGADSETGERTLAFIASELAEYVQDIIRTEKLKLLAEVRERAMPNPTTPAGENELVSLEELTKLEAEL